MKRNIITAGLFTVGILFVNHSNAQVLPAGSALVEVHYGYPNLLTSLAKNLYVSSGSVVDLKISGIGPMGVRAEYLLTNVVGIGLEGNYVNTSITYDSAAFFYQIAINRVRVFPRMNFHFVQNSDMVDAYAIFGAGYHKVNYAFKTNDPNFIEETFPGWFPVAIRMGVGIRVFFAGLLGAGMEFGIGGGGLITVGLCLRFGYLG